jgi:hypothetical protein
MDERGRAAKLKAIKSQAAFFKTQTMIGFF